MTPTHRLLAASAVVGCVFVSSACSFAGHSGRAATLVHPSGKIGNLQIGSSGARAVIASTGRPDADRRGVEYDGTPYRALGYDCSAKPSDDSFPVLETQSGRHGPSCKTVFWINLRTRRLGDFYTISPHYEESHGVRIGMATATAERILHQRVYVGCEENLRVGAITVAFTGGVGRTSRGSSGIRLIGGHVYAFAAHGGRSDVGIFDCL